jgi:hypothetical protein
MTTEQKGLFSIAIFCAIVACGLWFVFLRPVPIQRATGTVTDKIFKPAGEYAQNRSGSQMSYIPIAESYIFIIQIDGSREVVRYSLNRVGSREFDVGKRVQIEFKRRGIPLLWSRLYVLDMHAIK